MEKARSLFLAANPQDTERLNLDKEVREITAKIRASEYRDSLELISVWAVRPDDLLQSLNSYKPQIVHFSGHGSAIGEIVLADSAGKAKPVSATALKKLFMALKDNIQLVILNACYSKIQAEAIAEVIDCTIGMNDQIGDEAAIIFVASFYRAIGFGRSIQEAFDQGVTALLLEGIPEEHIPELILKKDVDPYSIFLVVNSNTDRSVAISELPIRDLNQTIVLKVETGDITTFKADVIGLKYAQALFGADEAVVEVLGISEDELAGLLSRKGSNHLLSGRGKVSATSVLFINVGELFDFDYEQIRKFSADTLRILANKAPNARHLAMTIHGVGYGLDETESFRAQIAGFFDAIEAKQYPTSLKQITIVEFHPQRSQLLRFALQQAVPNGTITVSKRDIRSSRNNLDRSVQIVTAGRESREKPHIFVAIPPDEQMADVFYYGILRPVNAAGYLCEKIDTQAFTGDIFERVKQRIETAALVIAELTGGNSNVSLELGYALGRGQSVILLAQNNDKTPFDIRGQRCILYSSIRQLEESLTKALDGLTGTS